MIYYDCIGSRRAAELCDRMRLDNEHSRRIANSNNNRNDNNMLHGSCWTRPRGPWWVDDFSCKVTLTQWIRNQVTGSGFIRWLQPSWQTARWAGRTNGHWFFNKGPEAVSQPGYGDIFSRGDGLLLMMVWLAPDHRPPHQHLLHLQLHTFLWPGQCPHTGVNGYYPQVQLKLQY